MNKLPIARNNNIVVQSLGKEVLIYDLNMHKAYNLNETSSIIYNACDGKTTFSELKSETNFTDGIIFYALDELRQNNLLEDKSFVSPFSGMSRREAIKKVGLTSMIALPLISSLVAPTAAMAASGLAGVGGACVNPNDCRACANGNTVQCRNNNAVCPTGVTKCCDCS